MKSEVLQGGNMKSLKIIEYSSVQMNMTDNNSQSGCLARLRHLFDYKILVQELLSACKVTHNIIAEA